jgi:hypothetical protein
MQMKRLVFIIVIILFFLASGCPQRDPFPENVVYPEFTTTEQGEGGEVDAGLMNSGSQLDANSDQ